jgi:hypothetical protein
VGGGRPGEKPPSRGGAAPTGRACTYAEDSPGGSTRETVGGGEDDAAGRGETGAGPPDEVAGAGPAGGTTVAGPTGGCRRWYASTGLQGVPP